MRIFIVSEHPVMQWGWSAMLTQAGGFTVVGDADRGSKAIAAIAAAVSSIDLVLVDIELPDMSGAELIRKLLPLYPLLRFAVLAESDASLLPLDSMALAPHIGQIHRTSSVGQLSQILCSLRLKGQRNGAEDSSSVNPRNGADNGSSLGQKLTQRERELLALMGLGLSNQQISDRLRIAMPTVKFHVTHILSKMGADNRTEAVLMGLRHGLVRLQ